jgi:hypothetical protein
MGDLRCHWTLLVGAQLAAVTRPARMKGDALVILVSSQAWMFEFEGLRAPLTSGLPQSIDGVRPDDCIAVFAPLPDRCDENDEDDASEAWKR